MTKELLAAWRWGTHTLTTTTTTNWSEAFWEKPTHTFLVCGKAVAHHYFCMTWMNPCIKWTDGISQDADGMYTLYPQYSKPTIILANLILLLATTVSPASQGKNSQEGAEESRHFWPPRRSLSLSLSFLFHLKNKWRRLSRHCRLMGGAIPVYYFIVDDW